MVMHAMALTMSIRGVREGEDDMAARDQVGRARYGVPLQPHNGRDALRDAYEEALDLCAYLRQAIMERDGK